MGILEALILGVIQGLTEFLPVSSSGHIEIGKAILGQSGEAPLLFTIMVHGATALSTIFVYWRSIIRIFKGMFTPGPEGEMNYALKILISMIPVGFVGVFLKEEVESLFQGDLLLVGSMLWVTGILLYLTTRFKNKQRHVAYKDAFIIGISQALAVLPGISRSGSTISTSLMLGVSREEAARFSFLMVLPPILGATAIEVKDLLEMKGSAANTEVLPVVIGSIAAFLAGVFACKWMIQIVQRARLIWFTFYCFLVGTIAIIVSQIA